MNKSDLTRDYCMLKGPLAKKGMTGGGIPSRRRMWQPVPANPFMWSIFSAIRRWPRRSRSWSGTTPPPKRPADGPPTAW